MGGGRNAIRAIAGAARVVYWVDLQRSLVVQWQTISSQFGPGTWTYLRIEPNAPLPAGTFEEAK